ncbi:MAG: 2-isopropylmalate synthase [Acidiferrobacteraceae bacterium]
MMNHPESKYRPFVPVPITSRHWPERRITAPPIWMSTDLRDGNQALFEPMDHARKLRMFNLLVALGFKEIEVGFPSASQIEFDFIRALIEEQRIPEDVTIEVLTPARETLIHRTMESLRGAPRAIVHLYNATAPVFRRIVFGLDVEGVVDLAMRGAQLIGDLAAEQPQTDWRFEYSPETFTATEPEVSRRVCDAVAAVWNATAQRKVIINLPATVELATPNVFADQVEWMHRHLSCREAICLSVHPHNDRGTAVAAAELALMAGADRVEGCLFGNGERTGNVDLVTLALNLYTQGINPGIDLSDIGAVARTYEECTGLTVPARHPYAGDLVFTAFAGSHQDAIRKGFAARARDAIWEVPYLPIDPQDIGRRYDSIIRVNSQSGRGGVAYLIERDYGLALPRRLQIEVGAAVQTLTELEGEVTSADIWALIEHEYLARSEPLRYVGHELSGTGDAQGLALELEIEGRRTVLRGHGNGPIDALLDALSLPVTILGYEEHALSAGANAQAAAFVEVSAKNGSRFGIGIHANIVTASLLAVISGINRLYQGLPMDPVGPGEDGDARRAHAFGTEPTRCEGTAAPHDG